MPLKSQNIHSGQFLLATELLDGGFFEQAIILILDHDINDGSYGIILNQHSHIPLNEVFSGLPQNDWKTHPFFLGGPVDDSQVQILQLSPKYSENPEEVIPGVYMGGRIQDSLQAMEDVIFAESTRLVLGYSGWGAGQLEEELKQGAWKLYSTNTLNVLNCSIDELKLSPNEFINKFEGLFA